MRMLLSLYIWHIYIYIYINTVDVVNYSLEMFVVCVCVCVCTVHTGTGSRFSRDPETNWWCSYVGAVVRIVVVPFLRRTWVPHPSRKTNIFRWIVRRARNHFLSIKFSMKKLDELFTGRSLFIHFWSWVLEMTSLKINEDRTVLNLF